MTSARIFSSDFPPTRAMVEHEHLHCQGHDHIGMGTMAGILARHRGVRVALGRRAA